MWQLIRFFVYYSNSEEDHFSPCLSYFDTRYVIGVGSQTKEVMGRFISKHGNYRNVGIRGIFYLVIFVLW